jgi:hypothetical protein
LTFSAVVLIVAGIMRVFDAIWAFRYNGTVVDNLHDAIFGHSLTTYGWVWLGVGIVLILGGIAVMGGGRGAVATISRWFGVVAAAVAGITAVSWMPYYPVWSIAYIGVAAAVIYGLTAHFGGEPESAAHAPGMATRVTGVAAADTTSPTRTTARG